LFIRRNIKKNVNRKDIILRLLLNFGAVNSQVAAVVVVAVVVVVVVELF